MQQGILVERSRDAYSFSHLTFQEYLTAKCIVDNRKTEQIVRDHLIDQRWREVFLLVAGLVPGKRGGDAMLQEMEKIAQEFLSSQHIQPLVFWADSATNNSLGKAKAAAKRTAALALALDRVRDCAYDSTRANAHARASDLAHALGLNPGRACALDRALDLNLDLSLAYSYQKLEIFDSEKISILIHNLKSINPFEYDYRLALKVWFYTINLNPDFSNISDDDIRALTEYLYCAELMIRCKEAAVRVSPKVWEVIESRILTVPTS